MSRCFAFGCKTFVPNNKLGCLKHWKMLPPAMRDEVWDAYRKKDRDRTLELALDAAKLVKEKEQP